MTNELQHRDTLLVESIELVERIAWPDDQFTLRFKAPGIAARALPGSFIHLRCDERIPMRRPLSLQRADRASGTIEILFRVVGDGLSALAGQSAGARLSAIGPIGRSFEANPSRPLAVLIGGGVGIPPMVFLAESMSASGDATPVVFMGSESPFPFETSVSELASDGIAADVDLTMRSLEANGIVTRLASLSNFQGCYRGYVTDLAAAWIESRTAGERERMAIYACGPTPMLKATADLARRFDLPCQVSLEEFMACAVGGCAGCTVETRVDDVRAMKRVCVDGPVFDVGAVFF